MLLVTLSILSVVPQLKGTDRQEKVAGSLTGKEMERWSSGVYTGTLSQAAQKILAVLRAQSLHAGRRNRGYTDRRWQSQSGQLFSFLLFLNAASSTLLAV